VICGWADAWPVSILGFSAFSMSLIGNYHKAIYRVPKTKTFSVFKQLIKEVDQLLLNHILQVCFLWLVHLNASSYDAGLTV